MNKTEYIGKLNALYVGEKNCLEELITAYDEKDKEIERLNNIIKEVREYIKDKWEMELKDSMEDFLDHDERIERKRLLHILEILDKENKQ